MLSTLYSTDTSAPLNSYGVELTDYIQDISGITFGSDFAKSYYMGYLPQDSFPESVFGINMPVLTNDNTTLILNNFVKENRPWGFCWFYDYNSNDIQASFQAYYFNSSNQLTRYRTQSWASIRFINDITMASLSFEDRLKVTIAFLIVPTANIDENGTGEAVTKVTHDESMDLEDLRKFVAGQASITCTLSQTYVATTKVITYADFDPNTMTMKYVDGDYTVYGQVQNFKMWAGQKYTDDGNTAPNINVLPFFRTHIPDGFDLPEQDMLVVGYNYTDVSGYRTYETATGDDTKFEADASGLPYVGSYDGSGMLTRHIYRGKYPLDSINMEDIQFLPGVGRRSIIKNCLFYQSFSGYTGQTFSFEMVFDFKDILKAVMLRNCIQSGRVFNSIVAQTTYTAYEYVSFFNGDDIPYFDNMPINQWGAVGNYAIDSGLLRPWQLPGNSITEDVFDVGDMPEYNPSEGDDARDDNYGDSISMATLGAGIGGTGNFITHWVLKRSELEDFGEFLWKNLLDLTGYDPSDPNYNIPAGIWNNLQIAWKTFYQTGSFDPASVLDMIIGLRYYPFELTNKDAENRTIAADAGTNCVYFGIGKYGVVASSNHIHVIGASLHTIKAGYWDCKDFMPYADFRDYEGSTAMVYIPFCGSFQIPIANILPSTNIENCKLQLYYSIDFCTGTCVATLIGSYPNSGGGDITYPIATAQGQIGFEVPITATNANRINAAIMGNVQKGIGAITSAVGETAMAAYGTVSSGESEGGTNGTESTYLSDTADNLSGVNEVLGGTKKIGAAVNQAVTNFLNSPSCSVPCLQGGHGWGSLGMPTTPYIQIRRGKYVAPTSYSHTVGRPNILDKTINSIGSGKYAIITNVDTSGIECTSDERQMIKSILESGFYA